MSKLYTRKNLRLIIVGLVIAVFVLLVVDLITSIHCYGDVGVSHVSVHVPHGADFINRNKRNNKHVENQDRSIAPSHRSDAHAKEKAFKEKFNFQINKATTIHSTINELDTDLLSNISFSPPQSLTEDKNKSSDTMFFTWASQNISSFEQPAYVINGTSVCQNDTELIIIMPAVPDHQFTRDLVRNTWAGVAYGIPWPRRKINLKTSLAFIFGTKDLPTYKVTALTKESKRYHDIVAADFIDSYLNLTLKMMVGLDWVSKYCPQARYVLKCDLDTFVNLPVLTKLLPKLSAQVPSFIIGSKHDLAAPRVLRKGKWTVSSDVYPMEYYPAYVIGHSYVITTDIVSSIVSVAHTIPLIPMEDVFITGIIARILRVQRLHHPGFADLKKKSLPCEIVYNKDFTMTKMALSRLLLMWRYVELNSCPDSELPFTWNQIMAEHV